MQPDDQANRGQSHAWLWPGDERARLLLLGEVAGTIFGTEDFCLFLYSLIRMQRPETVVELGTGLGASAFWMALAAKRNGVGHVWTVDNLELFARNEDLVPKLASILRRAQVAELDVSTPEEYYKAVSTMLGLDAFLTFVHKTIDLDDEGHFDHYPFGGMTIDLLFSDFRHGPTDVLAILAHFLPRMSQASSVFIDSAPTAWPSYLLLEQVVAQLNRGQVPKALQDRCTVDLRQIVCNVRILLVHLTKWGRGDQNGTAWLKIEPIDVLPQPRTKMRGY
jgi:methyltransferase family protein